MYCDLEECKKVDSSLDLDCELLQENFGKSISESYQMEDLCKPLNK